MAMKLAGEQPASGRADYRVLRARSSFLNLLVRQSRGVYFLTEADGFAA
jgi:hypothetical protein